jgi:hypothetical protein
LYSKGEEVMEDILVYAIVALVGYYLGYSAGNSQRG